MVIGAVVVVMLAFALWVRSVPPKTIPKPILQQPQAQGGAPDFMNIETEPLVKKEVLKESTEEAPAKPIEAAAAESMDL